MTISPMTAVILGLLVAYEVVRLVATVALAWHKASRRAADKRAGSAQYAAALRLVEEEQEAIKAGRPFDWDERVKEPC